MESQTAGVKELWQSFGADAFVCFVGAVELWYSSRLWSKSVGVNDEVLMSPMAGNSLAEQSRW